MVLLLDLRNGQRRLYLYGVCSDNIRQHLLGRRTGSLTDFSPCAFGAPGIVQVIQCYLDRIQAFSANRGRSVIGEDDCPCGRSGKYFRINGRLKMAEIRGCSDTYATNW